MASVILELRATADAAIVHKADTQSEKQRFADGKSGSERKLLFQMYAVPNNSDDRHLVSRNSLIGFRRRKMSMIHNCSLQIERFVGSLSWGERKREI